MTNPIEPIHAGQEIDQNAATFCRQARLISNPGKSAALPALKSYPQSHFSDSGGLVRPQLGQSIEPPGWLHVFICGAMEAP
jgi:hypothetical protein